MAYDTKELEEKALAAIKEHELVFMNEVYTFLPCSPRAARDHRLPELPSIKKALEDNRIEGKLSSRRKWKKSKIPTLQIAYYKLLASEDELRRLTGQYIDHTTQGEKINEVKVQIVNPQDPVTTEDDIDENI